MMDLSGPYGVIVYQFNERSPDRLFIIGISHRDAVTFSNGNLTSKAQAETYMIADGLIHHEGVELLLPEGYFGEKGTNGSPGSVWRRTRQATCDQSSDVKILERRLSDDLTFINAEMLLTESHPLRVRKVEEETLYCTTRECLLDLITLGKTDVEAFFQRSRLDYLQERRAAAMLQNAPEIIEQEFQERSIKSKKAILTIGAAHIHQIMRYLEEGRINIPAPLSKSTSEKDYISELTLLKENFGVFILLPKTLAQDREVLEVNRLGNIVSQTRRQPGKPILPELASAED